MHLGEEPPPTTLLHSSSLKRLLLPLINHFSKRFALGKLCISMPKNNEEPRCHEYDDDDNNEDDARTSRKAEEQEALNVRGGDPSQRRPEEARKNMKPT
ncbi:hypothetical protein L596_008876 [Steinernema carpocapsae]|uniref:Uncharacterized protein n=1 Tax=Steinernema carpocapsae TaxID=34508 RepID=A0A4U5PEA0_STECR|nr:hypothetical protein L596_008876 [Steinernema carpocapsae]